jgi:hypothetical protein
MLLYEIRVADFPNVNQYTAMIARGGYSTLYRYCDPTYAHDSWRWFWVHSPSRPTFIQLRTTRRDNRERRCVRQETETQSIVLLRKDAKSGNCDISQQIHTTEGLLNCSPVTKASYYQPEMRKQLDPWVGVRVTLFTRIRDVLGSKLGHSIWYPDWRFSWFSQAPPDKSDSILIRHATIRWSTAWLRLV